MTPGRGRSTEAVILLTLLVAVTCGIGLYLFPASVESIRRDVPFSYADMGLMTGMVQAGYLLSALASAVLTVRFGPLPIIHFCMIICTLALGGVAYASDTWTITLCLASLGGCASAIWIPIIDIITRITPAAHRGKALGLASSGTSYGVVAISYLTPPYFDGTWRDLWCLAFAASALATLIAFIRLRWLRHLHLPGVTRNPTVRIGDLPRRATVLVPLIMFFTGLTCTPFQNYLASYLEVEQQLPKADIATTWWLIGATGMAGGLAVGALADRISLRPTLVASYALLAAAPALLMQTGSVAGLSAAAAICFGLAFYAVFGLVPAYVAQAFPPGAVAPLVALMNVAQGIGGFAGNVTGGWAKDASGSFAVTYGVALCAALAATAACASLPRDRRPA